MWGGGGERELPNEAMTAARMGSRITLGVEQGKRWLGEATTKHLNARESTRGRGSERKDTHHAATTVLAVLSSVTANSTMRGGR